MDPINDSTEGYARSHFTAHGRVQVELQWPWMLNWAEGPFNRELVLALSPLLEAHIPAFRAQGPWVLLALIRHSTLATDEALATFTLLLQRLVAADMAPRAVAHVTQEHVEGAGLMDEAMERCFVTAGIPFANFREEAPARDWLAQRLAGG